MKKKKKAITIILIVFILVFGFIFGGYFAIKTVMTKGAINYLQDKYNMSYNQITVLDYEMKKFGNDTSFLPLNTYWSPYKWELQYNDKSFLLIGLTVDIMMITNWMKQKVQLPNGLRKIQITILLESN